MKKLLATVSVAGLLVAGTAATASAADAPTPRGSGGPTAEMFRPRLHILKGAFQVVMDTLQVTKQELRAALQNGDTIADLATAKGIDPKVVEDALVAAATKKLDEAVAAGKLEQQRAERIKQRLPERAYNFVHREWPRIGERQPTVNA